jgi:hypothetical protein
MLWLTRTSVALALLWSAASVSPPSPVSVGRLRPAETMHDRRADHTATLLLDGTVLITGGMVANGVFLNTAELYDPQQNSFSLTGDMLSPRVEHTATLLPNGRVLIAGGLAGRTFEGGPGVVATTEIYDPSTHRFTAGPNMTTPRTGHGAVLLPNGNVLIIGGSDDKHGLASAEIYDPMTNHFSAVASMQYGRIGRAAVLLQDGRVLVTGGNDEGAAELYDPQSGSWQVAAKMIEPRGKHAAVLLRDGRVLIVGGQINGAWGPRLSSSEIYDPRSGTFSRGPAMNLQRFKLPCSVVRLANGNVLVAGGAEAVEVYDHSSQAFLLAGNIDSANYYATATLLRSGDVLITGGGLPGRTSSNQAWLYQP